MRAARRRQTTATAPSTSCMGATLGNVPNHDFKPFFSGVKSMNCQAKGALDDCVPLSSLPWDLATVVR